MSEDRLTEDIIETIVRRDVGRRIRDARLDAGLSQAELAALLNRRQAYISELETGKTEPSVTLLVILSRTLKQPVISFISETWRDLSGREKITEGDLSVEELEVLRAIREVEPTFHYHLAIHLVKSLAEYDIKGEAAMREIEELERQARNNSASTD
jgi:transcriptional regulator with XRE-family HTH domain